MKISSQTIVGFEGPLWWMGAGIKQPSHTSKAFLSKISLLPTRVVQCR